MWKTDLPPAAAPSGPTPASSAACIIDALLGGGRVSLAGVAARGLVNVKDPRRSRGRDVVGTRSDGTKPNLPFRLCRHIGTVGKC